MSEWQPIETAPKNGIHILLTWRSLVTAGYWTGAVWESHIGLAFPTHWMHFPAPPK